MSAATVVNRVLNFWSGHKLNRVGKITNFDNKYGKGFRKQAAHPHQIFLGVPSLGTMKWFINKCWTEVNFRLCSPKICKGNNPFSAG